MHQTINTQSVIAEVRRIRDLTWIGVCGSAAHKGTEFGQQSDIDILAIHPHKTRFFYRNVNGTEVEIHQYSNEKFDQIANFPHWFGSNWPWEVGKFQNAETLWGTHSPLVPTTTAEITALIGALGKVHLAQQKKQQGRSVHCDCRHELTALRHLVDKTWPDRFKLDDKPVGLNHVDQGQTWIAAALQSHVQHIRFYPEHQAGAKWLNDRWNLGLTISDDGSPA